MILPQLAAVMALLASGAGQADVEHSYGGATISRYGPVPPFGSGIVMTLRPVYIVTVEGARRKIYFIHGDDDVFLTKGGARYPDIGSKCDLTTQEHHIANDWLGDGGPDGPIGELIVEIRC